MRGFHLPKVSLARCSNRGVVTPILPPSKGILILRHAHPTTLIGGSGLSGRSGGLQDLVDPVVQVRFPLP